MKVGIADATAALEADADHVASVTGSCRLEKNTSKWGTFTNCLLNAGYFAAYRGAVGPAMQVWAQHAF